MANPPPPPPPTQGPGWLDAPPVTKIGAAGDLFWAIGPDNALLTTAEIGPNVITPPGGDPDSDHYDYFWGEWQRLDSLPFGTVRDLGLSFQTPNHLQKWALDMRGQLWLMDNVPGAWSGSWQGPNWNNAPAGLQHLATALFSDGRPMLWAITEDNSLIQCSARVSRAWAWTEWDSWQGPQVSKFAEVTAARQNGGTVQCWALDTTQQLWSSFMPASGPWTPWSGPNWNGAPSLIKIAACEMSGTRGQQLWGITQDHSLVSTFQETVGGGWSSWSTGSWMAAPPVKEIAACLSVYGCAHLWAVTLDQRLIHITQLEPAGDWGSWSPPT